jgi:hypothetical protein
MELNNEKLPEQKFTFWIKEALWSQEKGSSSSKPKKMGVFPFCF